MTKLEFLEILKKRLYSLNPSEIDDILTEYSQHIDIKIKQGKSESDAIADFGSIDDLVGDILSAYDVDPDFKYKSAKNTISWCLSRFAEFINKTASAILNLRGKEATTLFIKFMLVVGCLAVMAVPFAFVKDALYRILDILPTFLTRFTTSVLFLAIDLVFWVLASYALYIFVVQNVLKKEFSPRDTLDFSFPTPFPKGAKGATFDENPHSINPPKGKNVMDFSSNIVLLCLRFLGFFILIPFIFCTFMAIVGFGLCFSTMLNGYPLIGATLIIFGVMLCGISICAPLAQFVFKGGNKNEKTCD